MTKSTVNRRLLTKLARRLGVATEYRDSRQVRQAANDDALAAVVRAVYPPAEGPSWKESLRQLEQEQASQLVEPVIVCWQDQAPLVTLRVPSDCADRSIEASLTDETGQVRSLAWTACQAVSGESGQSALARTVPRTVTLPSDLLPGYYDAAWCCGPHQGRARVIVAPRQVYSWPHQATARPWGVFAPLHAVRREHGWGAGDFGDLADLARWAGTLGAQMIGTLPLLPCFADRWEGISPYAPISRVFWHELFLDLDQLPELAASPAARRQLGSAEFLAARAALDAAPLVDYPALVALRRRVLEPLAAEFWSAPSPRRAALERALASDPDLERYARFRAADELYGAPWSKWPAAAARGHLSDQDDPRGVWRYHALWQWWSAEQVATLATRARRQGTPWYLDFPLGVHGDGYDVWRDPQLFARAVAGGAPPDGFFTKGQNWGFPPLDPRALRATGHAYWIRALRHHMRAAGVLRLDHVMGLHRLFWVPRGFEARHGVYVNYPQEEFYAILAVESHRHQTALVGENLGTVPRAVELSMRQHGLAPMYVAQFSLCDQPARALARPQTGSVASVNTHDTATWAGFCQGRDIDDRVELGLATPDEAVAERAARETTLEALRTFLAAQHLPPGDPADWATTLASVLTWLARGPAQWVLVNLEDLWLEPAPQNVPGTWLERANWRRRWDRTLETLVEDAQRTALLRTIGAGRSRNNKPSRLPRPERSSNLGDLPYPLSRSNRSD